MSQILSVLSLPWVGTVLGVLGVILAIYFYWRAKQVMRVSYQIDEATIVGAPQAAFSGDLKILFRDIEVPQVTASYVRVWNSGNITIRKDALLASDPMSLVVSGNGQILRATVGSRTRQVIDASVAEGVSSRVAAIEFGFLDPGDGFSITIVHTAAPNDLDLKGTIIGLKRGFSNVEKDASSFLDPIYFMLALFTPMLAMSWVIVSFLPSKTPNRPVINSWSDALIFFGALAVSITILSLMIRHIPQRFGWRQAPKSLV